VDDFLITCKFLRLITGVIDSIRAEYKDIKVHTGPIFPYLGMLIDFSVPGQVSIKMTGMIEDIVKERRAILTERGVTPSTRAYPNSPASENLFKVLEGLPLLTPQEAKEFHTTTAKLLYVRTHSRFDLSTPVSLLTKRVKEPTLEDDHELDRAINYLDATKDLPLILRCELDYAHGVHPGGKGHT
jgi:hypothetical protein